MIIKRTVSPIAALGVYRDGYDEIFEISLDHINYVKFETIYAYSNTYRIDLIMNHFSKLYEVQFWQYENQYRVFIKERDSREGAFSISVSDYNGLISMAEDYANRSIEELSYGIMTYA